MMLFLAQLGLQSMGLNTLRQMSSLWCEIHSNVNWFINVKKCLLICYEQYITK